MNEEYLLSRYLSAVELLPRYVKEKLFRLPESEMMRAEEIRLRSASGLSVVSAGHETFLGESKFSADELADIVCFASGSSVHSAAESIRAGFITAGNGHRIGICGTAALRDGKIVAISAYSSLAIRISKEFPGIADTLIGRVSGGNGVPASCLIISPPGGGKTTLLRDFVRAASNAGHRVAVADERGEIAAMKDGSPGFDVGKSTDVMDMCPRAEAVKYLIRSMSPQIVAMDEISGAREAEAVNAASGCGVAIFATAHAADTASLRAKPLYAEMLRQGAFKYIIAVRSEAGRRSYAVSEWCEDA